MDTSNYTTTNSTINVNNPLKEKEKGKEEKGGRKEEIHYCEKWKWGMIDGGVFAYGA